MEEVDRVLTRLRRIDELQAGGGGRAALLGELRELVGEAEAWARAEGDARALDAVAGLRAAAAPRPVAEVHGRAEGMR